MKATQLLKKGIIEQCLKNVVQFLHILFTLLFSTLPIGDAGYLLAGISLSDASGDKSENSKGLSDYWIVKLKEQTTPVVTSLTLIDVEKDQDIITLEDGAVVDLDALGNPALTVRANTTPDKVDSVLFEFHAPSSETINWNEYQLVGDAFSIDDCYTLTPDEGSKVGAAWNKHPIDLNYNFDFTFTINLCGGADGMAFALQQAGLSSLGADGGDLGYYDIFQRLTKAVQPSLGIELDIWNNNEETSLLYDPPDIGSHMALVKNSDAEPLTELVEISPEINNCADRLYRIVWNSSEKTLEVYLDGEKKIFFTEDIVESVFSGDPRVCFGFTGGTGLFSALQTFCNAELIYDGSSTIITTRTERQQPYALFGDVPDSPIDYRGRQWEPGQYTLTATPYWKGEKGNANTITFEVKTEPFMIQNFTLVNAENDKNIQELKDGDVIDLAKLSAPNFNIQAITEPETVGSVVFYLSGPFTHQQTENNTPYAFFGDNPAGDFRGRLLPLGQYNLKATPYKEANAKGVAGMPLDINFTVVSGKEGLVAYYPFNGNAQDESGNGNHGTVHGATLTADRFGHVNSAYSFNGVDNFISVEDDDELDLTDAFTLSAWIYINSVTDDYQSFISTWYPEGTYVFEMLPDGQTLQLNLEFVGAAVSNVPIDFGKWYHVVGVSTGSEIKVYQNGQQTGSSPAFSDIPDTSSPLFIGAHNSVRDRNPVNGKVDDVRIYNRVLSEAEIQALYNESAISIKVDSTATARVGETIEIAVSTSELVAEDNIISYQFTLAYDATKLESVAANLTGTIAEGGNLQINSSTSGELRLGYITSTPLSGSGPIVNLRFQVTDHGNSALTLSDFLYNTEEITHLIAGAVLEALYGDVDADQQVLAYDAGLTLQFSVGLDPLPAIDPIPWESWRITSADVDGEEGITAHDAALILQKAIGLIEQFPVENSEENARMQQEQEQAEVEVKVENQEMVFYAEGSVVGFNLAADNTTQLLGTPVVLSSDLLQAFNSKPAAYAIGLATATPLTDNTAFMKVPFTGSGSVTLQMQVNGKPATVTVHLATGLVGPATPAMEIYPNPVTGQLSLKGMAGPTVAEIYSLSGELLQRSSLASSITDIEVAHFPKGVYILKLQTPEGVTVKRFVKQ